jgi:hypothetical protein
MSDDREVRGDMLDLRPRPVGEILDDAWRLALADAVPLLFFCSLFLVPAFAAIVALLALPVTTGPQRLILPLAAAILLPVTGVGSGACQEWLRRRAEGAQAEVAACLAEALRRGLAHAAARATVLLSVLLGLLLLIVPGLAVWAAATPLHALLANGRAASGGLMKELGREAAFDFGRAALVTVGRLPLLLIAALNLHLDALALLWAGGELAGFDTSLFLATMSFFNNPVYLLGLLLLAWVLLAPYFEALSFLLHLDTRTRQEGLDLFFRVRRIFPSARTSVSLLLAVTAGVVLAGRTAQAAELEPEKEAVRAAAATVAEVRAEVAAAEPYPGGDRWQQRLQRTAERLEQAGGQSRYRWFGQALAGFAGRSRAGALQVLDDLQWRLSLDTDAPPLPAPEAVKALLRRDARQRPPSAARPEKKGEDRQPRRAEPDEPAGRGGGPAHTEVPVAATGGLGSIGWAVLAGLAVAVLGAAVYRHLARRCAPKPHKPATQPAPGLDVPDLPLPEEKAPAELWRKAKTLAAAGRHPEALRLLYLAVLFLLDRSRLLHFERTRTNGEYLRQIRRAEHVPAALGLSFEQLTSLFERTWYGECSCTNADYQDGERLAQEVHQVLGMT